MKKSQMVVAGIIGAWLVLSLVSLVAMYHLWWTRERVLYVGKSPAEQRPIVFARAGIPAATLDLALDADADWPGGVAYEAAGSEVSLSYFKYLVLPRVPSGSSEYRIEEVDGAYRLVSGAGRGHARVPFQTVRPTPVGLVFSALILFAVAAGLSRFGFSIPEGVACATLALCWAGLLSKGLFRTFMPAGLLLCALGLAGAGLACRHRNPFKPASPLPSTPRETWLRRSALAILAASVIWALLMAVVVVPDDWDCWAQWGPKAKLLATSAGPVGAVSYFVPGSGDYPLLWPSVWALSGWCAGGWEEQWSKGWGAVFFLLAAWQLLVCAERAGGSRIAGWTLAAAFASMPLVPLVASWGYAEAPLWLMSICAMTRLLQWRESGARRELWRAGLFLAAAACTKNEGVLLAVLCTAWVALAGRRVRDLLATGLPSLLCVGAWKTFMGLTMGASNHVLIGLDELRPNLDGWAGRLSQAVEYVLRHWTDVRQWNLVLPSALVAAACLAWRGGPRARMELLLPFALLGALFTVVLLHGDDWYWQLCVAWNRLSIQFAVVLMPVLAFQSAGPKAESSAGRGSGGEREAAASGIVR
jgi:hypothetical protein